MFKVIETFSGIGSQAKALENIGIKHKILCTVDWDINAIIAAIERTNNLVSITDIKGEELSNDVDLLTYSFPCQDLSVAGFWHGNKGRN